MNRTAAISRPRKVPLIAGAAVCAAAFAVFATPASAAVRTVGDGDGRRITFDAPASAPVSAYGKILANAVHGNEIEDVRIRVVSKNAIGRFCGGQDAAACYSGGRRGAEIIIPLLPAAEVTPLLLHEYGHHVDTTRRHRANARGLDGTQRWWSARGMTKRLNQRQVGWGYERGWQRSIGEIFAEDYAQLNGSTDRYRIRWLPAPSKSVLNAMRRDLNAAIDTSPSRPSARDRGLTIRRRGTLAAGSVRSIPFGLLGPGRRVNSRVVVQNGGGTRAITTEIRCNGRRVATDRGRRGSPATINRANLGPGDCELRIRTHGQAVSIAATLALRR